jgi:hypothetical protein
MIADLLFAACAIMVAIATVIMFYGSGFLRGYDRGRRDQSRLITKFTNQARESFAQQGLVQPNHHGRQGLN